MMKLATPSHKIKNRIKHKLSERIMDAIIVLLMVVLMFLTVYPLLYTIFASLSDARRLLMHDGPLWFPIQPMTLMGYEKTLSNRGIVMGFRNTLGYVVGGTTFSLLITTLGAFVLSRPNFLPRGLILKFIMMTMFFSGGLIPLFFVVKLVGIYDTPYAFVLPYCLNTYNMIIMRTFFQGIPASLEESAVLDGATDLQVMMHIFIPLSSAVIAVITMYYGVSYWNSWYPAVVFMRTRSQYPLQMFLREILILNEVTDQLDASTKVEEAYYRELVKYCTVVVSTVPILVIYPFLQRYFVKGVMIGAIKG
ncbi:MAG: carbohydrate ABC transporter permease [Clostridia bacterium]